MLISKADIARYFQFSTNIDDRLINYHISDAETFELQEAVPAAFWTALANPDTELQVLLDNYIKPLLCAIAYRRFIAFHGLNITQHGILLVNEESSVQVSTQRLAYFMNDIKGKENAYWSRFKKAVSDADYTYDGVEYDFDWADIRKPGNDIGIRVAGGSCRKYYDKKNDCCDDLRYS